MKHRQAGLVPGWAAAIGLAMALPALAQTDAAGTLTAPDYGSEISAGAMSDSHFNTPESDGRPGVKFFTYGVQAFKKSDYRHAIDMYKVAASWAYKPAEYNLGVMYFKGQGVPVDRARGAAWMVLAAERGEPRYMRARDLMVTVLTDTEFKRTDAIWDRLKQTYGDKVALRRAKAQWAWVRDHKTGTRVGGAVGELAIGVLDTGHTPRTLTAGGTSATTLADGFSLMQGGSVDGAIGYRQFGQSENPYDPIFLKNRKGNVTIEPLQPTKPASEKKNKNGGGKHDPARPDQSAQGA